LNNSQVFDRIQSTQREDYGPDIYKKVLFTDKPRQSPQSNKNRNIPFNNPITSNLEPVTHAQNHTNFYEGERQNRSSHRSSYQEKIEALSSHQNRRVFSPLRQPQAEEVAQSQSGNKRSARNSRHSRDREGHQYEEPQEVSYNRPPLPTGQMVSGHKKSHQQDQLRRSYQGADLHEADRRCLSARLHEYNIRSIEKTMHNTYYHKNADPVHDERDEEPCVISLPEEFKPRELRSSERYEAQSQAYGDNLSQAEVAGFYLPESEEMPRMKDKLSSNPDTEEVEAQRKREYQKKIDEYHRRVADAKLEQKLANGSAKKRQAVQIREENAQYEAEVRQALQEKKVDQESYKQVLDRQKFDMKMFKEEQKIMEEGVDKTTGKSLGLTHSAQKKRQPGVAIERLGKELQETINYRKKLEKLTRTGNAEELLRHTWTLDRNNIQQVDRKSARLTLIRKTLIKFML
jgi:hypothetical protein